jgi:DNA-binding FadR family transcriptional regulator
MVIAFLARNGLYPGKQPRIFDERITDDMFAITFAIDNATDDQIEKITDVLSETGVKEIKKKDFNDSEY